MDQANYAFLLVKQKQYNVNTKKKVILVEKFHISFLFKIKVEK